MSKKRSDRITLKDFISQLPHDEKSLKKKLYFHSVGRLDMHFLSVYTSDDGKDIEIDVGYENE